jgi:hypothetical protein
LQSSIGDIEVQQIDEVTGKLKPKKSIKTKPDVQLKNQNQALFSNTLPSPFNST